jgi:hypothetical protein
MSLSENDFQNEKFFIEVSARYHDYRRAALEWCTTLIRLVSLLGSIASLLAVSAWIESSNRMVFAVTIASVVVGIANLFDLVFQIDSTARTHTSLYQRFKALQGEMARKQVEWHTLLPEWQAEAQSIRIDEPPTYWAVYTRAWNQTAERYRLFGHKHKIRWYQSLGLISNILHFRPDQFGFAASKAQ